MAETVPHEDENGSPDGVLIDLYETSVLDQRPFAPIQRSAAAQTGKRRAMPIVTEGFDDEEEDPVSENAFDDYYLENDELDDMGSKDLIPEENNDHLPTISDFVQETTRGWATFATVLGCDTEARKIFKVAVPGTFSAISSSFLKAICEYTCRSWALRWEFLVW